MTRQVHGGRAGKGSGQVPKTSELGIQPMSLRLSTMLSGRKKSWHGEKIIKKKIIKKSLADNSLPEVKDSTKSVLDFFPRDIFKVTPAH